MKYLLVDEHDNLSFGGDTLEDVIAQYEDYTNNVFKNEQGKLVYIVENPQRIEVEFKVIKKEVVTKVLNKGK